MIGFLNNAFLYGLIGVGIPILIHLFARQKIRTVRFSSTAMLSELQIRRARRFRLAQLLLLILRCLAIGLLVLAFARPTIRTGTLAKTGDAPVSALLMIDRSFSMQRGRLFAEAQNRALAVIDRMRSRDRVALMWSDSSGIADGLRYSAIGSLREEVRQSPATFGKNDWPGRLSNAVRLFQEEPRIGKELFWIWDMQRTAFSAPLDSVPVSNPHVFVYVLPVSGGEDNAAVIRAVPASQILDPAAPVRIDADVKNFGSREIQNLWVRAYVEGRPAAQKTLSIEPGGEKRVTFMLDPGQTGWVRGSVEIEDDILSADNVCPFVLHVPEQIRVRLVGHEPDDLKYPELVFRAFRSGHASLETESFTGQADWTGGLDTDRVLLFCDVPRFSPEETDRLESHIQQGGGAFFLLGPDVDLKHYADRLTPPLFTGTFQDASGESDASAFWIPGPPDRNHPVLAGLFTYGAPALESLHVFKRAALTSGAWAPILSYEDGMPLLAEARIGRGRVLVLSTGPDPAWSDLAVHSLFAPLIYRSVLYLSEGRRERTEALHVHDPVRAIVPIDRLADAFSVIRPDGRIDEIPPVFRNGAAVLEYPNTNLPGIYCIRSGDRPIALKAVQIDPNESDCRSITASDLKRRLSGLPHEIVHLGRDLDDAVERRRSGREIWRGVLAATLCILLIELILERLFVRRSVRNETL